MLWNIFRKLVVVCAYFLAKKFLWTFAALSPSWPLSKGEVVVPIPMNWGPGIPPPLPPWKLQTVRYLCLLDWVCLSPSPCLLLLMCQVSIGLLGPLERRIIYIYYIFREERQQPVCQYWRHPILEKCVKNNIFILGSQDIRKSVFEIQITYSVLHKIR